MRSPPLTILLAASVALAAGACASARFDTAAVARPARAPREAAVRPAPVEAPEEEPVAAAPPSRSTTVTAEPLPAPNYPGSSPSVIVAPPADAAPAPRPAEPRVASLPPAVSSGPSRTAVTGAWTLREGSGSTCRVQLSSSPSLDLYKASAAGCGSQDLQRITAWDYRDGEVFLYAPGGNVVARARGEGGALAGAVTRSGAPISLSR